MSRETASFVVLGHSSPAVCIAMHSKARFFSMASITASHGGYHRPFDGFSLMAFRNIRDRRSLDRNMCNCLPKLHSPLDEFRAMDIICNGVEMSAIVYDFVCLWHWNALDPS